MSPEFAFIRVSFAKIFFNVRKAMKATSDLSIEDMKQFLEDYDSDLKSELAEISTLEDLMRLIRKNCSLINVVLLEAVVEKFDIASAQRYIDEYKKLINQSCKNLSVHLCLNESFETIRTGPPLKCETATYMLGWNPEEYKLKDVTDIVSKSSGKLVKLINIKSTQSITITCSFPHSLTGALIIKLSENLELLIKNGLMKLTVGYCTIWKKQKIQVCVYILSVIIIIYCIIKEIQEPLEEEVQEIKEQPHDTKV